MSGFRIKLFRNGKKDSGLVISIPESYESLVNVASNKFEERISKLYLSDGSLLTTINLIRDNDTLYAAKEDERFQGLGPQLSLDKLCLCSKTKAVKSSSDWITLNVGGKLFTTTRNTLTRYPDTMLARMFSISETWKSAVDANGAYLIDRSPEYFEPILNFLRQGILIINEGVNQRGVLEEARFFGLIEIVNELESELQTIERQKQSVTRSEFMRLLMTTSNIDKLRCQGVDLAGADLSYLDLSSINFKHANLSGANLKGASLGGCQFNLADLSNACLDDATLEGVQMKRVNLESASLKNCKFEATGTKNQKANLEGANLKEASLEGSQMSNACLRLAVLKEANMRNCVLRGATLAGADLENCDLTGADLEGANLRGTNVVGTIFLDIVAPLHMVQFEGPQS